MAKRKGPNKSQAVRELLAENPKMPAKEIVSTLGAKGLKVNPSLIYFIKGKLRGKKQRRNRVVKAARAASKGGDPVALIHDVRALALRAGGYGKLRELVDALAD